MIRTIKRRIMRHCAYSHIMQKWVNKVQVDLKETGRQSVH
jgi:hypothetical protein